MFRKKFISKIFYALSAMAMLALSAPNCANAQYMGDNDQPRVTQASRSSSAATNQAAENPPAQIISGPHAAALTQADAIIISKTSSGSMLKTNKAAQKTAKATHTPATTSAQASAQPQQDATVIQGLGTVRVNMLANLEALLNIGANATEIIGVAWGASLLALAFIKVPKEKRVGTIVFAVVLITVGLSAPNISIF